MCRMLLFLCLLPIHPQCKTSHHFTSFAAAAAAAGTGGSTFRARTGGSNGGGRRRRPRSSGRSSLATTALKMHKLYVGQPPHDTSLYDLLGVAGNATLNEIQKAYRRKSREYHPDKARVRAMMKRRRGKQKDPDASSSDGDPSAAQEDADVDIEQQIKLEEEECEIQLAKLREAYEVLREDQTRLPYHKYGLVDTDTAAELLTGGSGRYGHQSNNQQHSPEQDVLLRLMGYEPNHHEHHQYHYHYHNTQYQRHQRRVAYLAANLVELIRPVVEGTISQQDLVQHVMAECDQVKSAPLGAQIIRCIGRAYRHTGRQVLREHRRNVESNPLRAGLNLSNKVTSKLRDAKHFLEAAYLSGKVVVTEQRTKLGSSIAASKAELERAVKEALPALDHPLNAFGEPPGGMDCDADIGDDEPLTSEELHEQEQEKAHAAVLSALQVEALWKIAKIELDRTIQEACTRILDGDYFFFPSHQQPLHHQSPYGYNDNCRQEYGDGQGWVGRSGEIIDTDVGRLRAAAAMVLVGDTMVDCSKDGTSWVD